jgi:AcrR family transcriptional regulator
LEYIFHINIFTKEHVMARRTQAQLAETRQGIITAAKRLFAEKGFANTQIAEIATAAGIGMSAFYGQFEDKEALFLLIVNEMFNELHTGVLAVRRHMDIQSPLDSLLAIQRIYDLVFDTLDKHKQITLSAFRSGIASVPALETLYWGICDAVALEMGQDLARSEQAGLIKVDSHRDMADAMVGMIQQLAHRMVREGSPTAHEAASVCTKFTLGALLISMPRETMKQVLPLFAAMPT